jgi:hypothetical protein
LQQQALQILNFEIISLMEGNLSEDLREPLSQNNDRFRNVFIVHRFQAQTAIAD